LTRFRKHSAYVIPLSLRALKIVSDLSIAMEARGFDPYAKRTFMRQVHLTTIDKVLIAAMFIATAVGIPLRVTGYGGIASGMMVGRGQLPAQKSLYQWIGDSTFCQLAGCAKSKLFAFHIGRSGGISAR
jgi:hypothetical protein